MRSDELILAKPAMATPCFQRIAMETKLWDAHFYDLPLPRLL